MEITKRLKYWWAAFGPFGKIIGLAYSIYGVVLSLAPPQAQADLSVWAYLPRLSGAAWLAGLFAVLLVAFMEGAFRVDQSRLERIRHLTHLPTETYHLICEVRVDVIALNASGGWAEDLGSESWQGWREQRDVVDEKLKTRVALAIHRHEWLELQRIWNADLDEGGRLSGTEQHLSGLAGRYAPYPVPDPTASDR
jgi:hypothetical protein